MRAMKAAWRGWLKIKSLVDVLAIAAAIVVSFKALQPSVAQVDLSAAGQREERYKTASEQLGSDRMDVRRSGVRTLARVAQDFPRFEGDVDDALTAFVRNRAAAGSPCSGRPEEDVQAALTVIGHRSSGRSAPINLSETCLRGADLHQTNFRDADLRNADLTFANLADADATGANLQGAQLVKVEATGVDLTEADLSDADLSEAHLPLANLTEAKLSYARLANANLFHGTLTGADLLCTNFRQAFMDGINAKDTIFSYTNLNGTGARDANLPLADLATATLDHTDLTRANLTYARFPQNEASKTNLTEANTTGVTYIDNTKIYRISCES